MKTVYKVTDHGVDGWGRSTVAYFEQPADAAIIRNKETSYKQGSVTEIIVFESIVSYEDYKIQSAKQKALAKLTPEERKLLGL